MVEKVVNVENKLGIHARPAASLVRLAAQYKSDVILIRDGQPINGKSIMSVIAMAAEPGSQITIRVDGPDEQEALGKLVALFESKFEEDDI
jgi:phosphocarrier protein HPr